MVFQGSVGRSKSQASGNAVTSHKHAPHHRHPKSGSKRNPNGAPIFRAPLPFHQPPVPPVFHTMVPAPHIPIPGYVYPPCPGPFPIVETHMVKPGSETPMQAFIPPVHTIDSDRSMQPSPRGDPSAFGVNLPNRRPTIQEPGGHLNHGWHHQRPFSSGDSVTMQQNLGPRAFGRPSYFAPAPGFIVGPNIPGNTSMITVVRCLHLRRVCISCPQFLLS